MFCRVVGKELELTVCQIPVESIVVADGCYVDYYINTWLVIYLSQNMM